MHVDISAVQIYKYHFWFGKTSFTGVLIVNTSQQSAVRITACLSKPLDWVQHGLTHFSGKARLFFYFVMSHRNSSGSALIYDDL